jgi:hypothetical protein
MDAAVELSGSRSLGGARGCKLGFDSVCLMPRSFCCDAVLLRFRS